MRSIGLTALLLLPWLCLHATAGEKVLPIINITSENPELVANLYAIRRGFAAVGYHKGGAFGKNNVIAVWDLATRKKVATIKPDDGLYDNVGLSPKGKYLVASIR